ncbi:MAG: CopG family transcriptional regulator [Candidatus Magasanikbacteria bacterium]|uniref:CopG family transcriptional regulator n=1 Tax=Candidatus Magasanikbacteria bacterium CG10_big_fil_rev_8_21_14_0_10_38_6 TaxID=1974647 RepID=A0A2M6P094_9BACT|nr:CopG family transcriptional regulator [Candidatus Magasanikbacteria bacterium]NCS71961.1 CopG family transcriptional regulator [Candidatus Magasanikbacteria bacterium]PIR77121.1 MAG: CopG family transcriptional regulator [Candidatus Magasanikbacteria bacterium CG10_big_fil_rev_8_21_14_0_10_38_6]
MKKTNRKNLKYGVFIGVFFLAIFLLPGLFNKNKESNIAHAETLTVYKDPSCGCCGNYAAYMRREGYDVEVIATTDMNSIKEKYNIPKNMQSCHTTVLGNEEYVIEGHIPVEAVQKLTQEKPDLAGIAMPGMPSGSPGMPGAKRGTFNIHGIDREGGVSQFIEL